MRHFIRTKQSLAPRCLPRGTDQNANKLLFPFSFPSMVEPRRAACSHVLYWYLEIHTGSTTGHHRAADKDHPLRRTRCHDCAPPSVMYALSKVMAGKQQYASLHHLMSNKTGSIDSQEQFCNLVSTVIGTGERHFQPALI